MNTHMHVCICKDISTHIYRYIIRIHEHIHTDIAYHTNGCFRFMNKHTTNIRYIHVQMHACIQTYTYTNEYIHSHIHTSRRGYMHIHNTHMHTHLPAASATAYMHTHLHIHTYYIHTTYKLVNIFIPTRTIKTCISVLTYIHTHTHTVRRSTAVPPSQAQAISKPTHHATLHRSHKA